jgi:predicted enzyme related to lactoylglutathione lyase
MTVPGHLWIGSIVMDVKEFGKMIEFWSAVLGYEPREAPESDWVVLTDPHRIGPNVSMQKVADGPGADYRYHFDLYSSDPEGEVKRVMALGAKMLEPAQPGRDFVTLADPDGNPFDVIDTKRFAFGQRRP